MSYVPGTIFSIKSVAVSQTKILALLKLIF